MNLLPLTSDLVRAFGWTILHSVWQAFLVYACLKVVLKLWPLASARIKYNLSVLSLSGIFVWFLVTLFQQLDAVSTARNTATTLHLQFNAADLPPVHAVYRSQDQLVWLFPQLELCFPILVGLYIAGMAVMVIKLVSDLMQLHQIRTHQVQPMGEAWEKHLGKLAARLEIPKKVKLLVSQYIQVPVMLGFFKPVILLPIAMVNNLSEEQLEAILLHELAHIKRNDYLLNIFQSIVETILFFNPFVWLISKTIRLEREHCCDDLVIASNTQPLHYARALVALEEYRLTANPMAMAAADNKQHLLHRIKRIMEMKTKNLNYSQKLLAVMIIAVGLIAIAWINPSKVKAAINESKLVLTQNVATNHISIAAPAPVPAPIPALTPAAAPAPHTGCPDSSIVPKSFAMTLDLNSDTTIEPVTSTTEEEMIDKRVEEKIRRDHADNELVDEKMLKKQIAEAQRSVNEAMRKLKNVDMKRLQAETNAAMDKIDWQAISAQAQQAQHEAMQAMKNVDWEKMRRDVQDATSKIDFKAMSEEIHKQLAENKVLMEKAFKAAHDEFVKQRAQYADAHRREAAAHAADAQALAGDVNARMNKANALRDEANARKTDAEAKARENATHARVAADRARLKAAEVRKQYQELINKLAEDKLVDPSKGFTIKKNADGLYINGAKQPASVLEKYKSYFNKKYVEIDVNGNSNFNVNVED
ncbi:M56 family metallopeptidase [Chitinophaga vietnamensis]|uniref:M56 family metallopeptidase n=1 Tax=Chitinophaga vietnamensis TaxID=2593957 RepID=UPI0011776083|nr:M56 family metallopeptidase [Chitinophaga vietnamensis]